jgi:hypothetical protein
MKKTSAGIALALCCALLPACGGLPTRPGSGALEVLVSWQGQGLPDRQLEIAELGLTRATDGSGRATFVLPAGSYTLRAFVNLGGPAGWHDFPFTVGHGEVERIEVPDCLPCVTPP